MQTILVEDEKWQLQHLQNECAGIDIIELAGSFQSPLTALEFARDNLVELAFLDIEMPKMTGLELARELRKLYPKLIIIFISAYNEYASEALGKLDADYYLPKPYDKGDLARVMERVRLLARRLEKPVHIETFGHFNVYIHHEPLSFSSKKAKELLAVLVDRHGGVITPSDGFTYLWGEKAYDTDKASAYRRCVRTLESALNDAGIGYIFKRLPRGCAINAEAVDCDYFKFLKGDAEARAAYSGSYMEDYSWAEDTRVYLDESIGKGI